jgi:hypothetical protein
MKRTLYFALMVYSCSAAAFDGMPKFSKTVAGVGHTLTLSNWTLDTRGIPSFDYVYQQHTTSCQFQLAGRVDGITEERDGKTMLEVYNPQNDDGSAATQVTMFFDDTVTITLPYKGRPRDVGISGTLTPAQRAQVCTRTKDNKLSVEFRK